MTALRFPMPKEEILNWIPHRPPMLMLDQVIEYEPGHSLVASKTLQPDDPIAKSHFPGHPVFPGVLLVECMAQASAVFGAFEMEGFEECFLANIYSARFRKPVLPGELITLKIAFKKRRQDFSWFSGQATVENIPVADVEFSALIR